MARPGSSRTPRPRRPISGVAERDDETEPSRSPTPSLLDHFARAVVGLPALLNQRRGHRDDGIEKRISEDERRIKQRWPEVSPKGDGQKELETSFGLRAWRRKWEVRTAVVDDLTSIACKTTLVVAGAVYVAQQGPW